jgi:hypothetical protein
LRFRRSETCATSHSMAFGGWPIGGTGEHFGFEGRNPVDAGPDENGEIGHRVDPFDTGIARDLWAGWAQRDEMAETMRRKRVARL